jgi:hypothetical protein
VIEGPGPLTPEEGKRIFVGILVELQKLNVNLVNLNTLLARQPATPPEGSSLGADIVGGLGSLLDALGVSVEPPSPPKRRR